MKPVAKIILDGADQTAFFFPRPKGNLATSLTITDALGHKSDRLELTMARRQDDLPKAGAKIEVWLGYDERLIAMGKFTLDQIESRLDRAAGAVLRIAATAADMTGKLKQARTKVYNRQSFGDIVKNIAARHGLEAIIAPQLAGLSFPAIHQTQESDMHFLTRLAEKSGGYFKLADDKLVFGAKGKALDGKGKERAGIKLDRGDIIEARWQAAKRDTRKSGRRAYTHDLNTGKRKKIEDKKPGARDEDVHELPGTISGWDEGVTITMMDKKKTKKGGGETEKLGLKLPGNPNLRASSLIEPQGLPPEMSGSWEVIKAVHQLGRNGYSTNIEARRKR